MNVETIKKALLNIQNAADDDAKQHELEDKLLWDFVKFVSERQEQFPAIFKLMATEILESKNIEFSRWYD